MIDINSDMGELTHLFEDRTYHRLMNHVTSINLACGGHAGNTTMMNELSKLAKMKNVRIEQIKITKTRVIKNLK